MILPDATITLDTGVFGTRGFTFSILGDEPSDGSEAPERSQGENPVFTADYNNNPFESGKIYLLTSFHPDYMDPTVVGRAVFNELGGLTFVSSAEAPGTGGGSVVNNLPPVNLIGAADGDALSLQQQTNGSFIVIRKLITLLQLTLEAADTVRGTVLELLQGFRNVKIFKQAGELVKGLEVYDVPVGSAPPALSLSLLSDVDGSFILLFKGAEMLRLTPDGQFLLGTSLMRAFTTKAVFSQVNVITRRAATDHTHPLFAELDPTNNQITYREGNLSDLGRALSPHLDFITLAQGISPYQQSVPIAGDLRYPAGDFLCGEFDDSVLAYSSQIITVATPTVGTAFTVSHTLNRSDLWASAKSLNSAIVEVVSPTQVSVYVDAPVDEFTFKLEPKNALT